MGSGEIDPGPGPHAPHAPRLLLASASPRRKEILERLGLDFDILPAPSHVEGEPEPDEAPETFAVRAARAKADAVAEERRGVVVVAADTIVVLDGEIMGKPADAAEAAKMLRRLAGRGHRVFTGVAVRGPGGGAASAVESTGVRFRGLSDPEIDAYVATGEPLDKAGAYGIQGYGATFVEGIDGCYFNVMGLPVVRLLEVLAETGWRYAFPGILRPA